MAATRISFGIIPCLVKVLAYLCGVLAVAILLAFCLISHLKLAVVRLYVRIRTGKSFQILCGLDAVAIYSSRTCFTDPLCPSTTHTVMVVEGQPDVGKLRQLVQQRMVDAQEGSHGARKYPRITQRVERQFGYFVWVEDQGFSVDRRVRQDGKGYADMASLVQRVQEIYAIPWDRQHPLWEVVVLPKIPKGSEEFPGEYAILLRVHHCMCDGVNLMLMGADLFDGNASLSIDFKKLTEKALPQTIRSNPFLRYLADPPPKLTLRNAAAIAFNALEIIATLPWQIAKPLLRQEDTNELHIPVDMLSGRKLLALSHRLKLQRFRDIATKCKCSINDVFLYCMTGALQRCNAASSRPTDPCATVFIPLFLFPSKKSWSENGISYVLTSLPVKNGSAVERLEAISNICQKIQSSTEPISVYLLSNALGNHLPLAMATSLFHKTSTYTMMGTNVRGPPFSPSLLGGHITDMFFYPVNCINGGVSFGVLSFREQMRLGVTVDRMVATHDNIAQQLADDFEDELKILHETTMDLS